MDTKYLDIYKHTANHLHLSSLHIHVSVVVQLLFCALRGGSGWCAPGVVCALRCGSGLWAPGVVCALRGGSRRWAPGVVCALRGGRGRWAPPGDVCAFLFLSLQTTFSVAAHFTPYFFALLFILGCMYLF